MRIALSSKLVLATTLGITLVLGSFGYLRFRREVTLLREDVRRDHRVLGAALVTSVEAVAGAAGVAAALEVLEDANRHAEGLELAFVPHAAQEREEALLGVEALVTRVPLRLSPDLEGHLEVRESLDEERAYVLDSMLRTAAALLLLAGLCAVIVHVTFRVFVAAPLARITDKLHRMGEGDLSGPIAPRGRDELAVVGQQLDATCALLDALAREAERESAARIEALEGLRHAERLGTVGTLASGIAHELGTPLNVVSARAKLILRGHSEGATAVDDARVIVEQVDRMTAIIRQLLDYARRRSPRREEQDLHPLLGKIVTLLQPLCDRSGVRLVREPGSGPLAAEVDEGQLQQVLTNLVMNAVQAQPGGGEVRLRARCSGTSDQEVVLEVEDDGPGLDPRVAQRIFEPFFTTKEVGRGTGLGLSVAHGIIEEHGGRIEVATEDGGGSRFSVHLPRRAA